jgi:hypothetical protein
MLCEGETMTSSRELFLAGLEIVEAERIARGTPPDTDDLRRKYGLPPRPTVPRPDAPSAPSSDLGGCNTVQEVSGQGAGHVTACRQATPGASDVKPGIDAAIAELSREGLSSRQIAGQLGMMGIDVSHMTVARHIRRAKVAVE